MNVEGFIFMLVDAFGNELNIGDECIISKNNKGLLKVVITRFNKTSIYYNILHTPNRKVDRASYCIIKKAKYNFYKI